MQGMVLWFRGGSEEDARRAGGRDQRAPTAKPENQRTHSDQPAAERNAKKGRRPTTTEDQPTGVGWSGAGTMPAERLKPRTRVGGGKGKEAPTAKENPRPGTRTSRMRTHTRQLIPLCVGLGLCCSRIREELRGVEYDVELVGPCVVLLGFWWVRSFAFGG